jgi:hypothetical protein
MVPVPVGILSSSTTRGDAMSSRKLIISLLAAVGLATVTAWLLWRSGVFDIANARISGDVRELTITEIPRPNSPTYTKEEATTLLPKKMARSRAIDPSSALVAGWKNPTHGFRVHVTATNDIETVNWFGEKQSGMAGLKSALTLSEAMQHGNPLSVLLTAETDGWQTETQKQILGMLFRPGIQLYIVTDK